MADKVTMNNGKVYDLVKTDETGNLMTVKENRGSGKEIQVPTANVEKIEKEEDNFGVFAVAGGLALFALTGIPT